MVESETQIPTIIQQTSFSYQTADESYLNDNYSFNTQAAYPTPNATFQNVCYSQYEQYDHSTVALAPNAYQAPAYQSSSYYDRSAYYPNNQNYYQHYANISANEQCGYQHADWNGHQQFQQQQQSILSGNEPKVAKSPNNSTASISSISSSSSASIPSPVASWSSSNHTTNNTQTTNKQTKSTKSSKSSKSKSKSQQQQEVKQQNKLSITEGVISSPSSSSNGSIKIELTNKHLWNQFNWNTTEMIITKQGRRMFPTLQYKLFGLDPNKEYNVFVDIILADQNHWKFQGGRWVPVGQSQAAAKSPNTAKSANNIYLHPDSPNTGTHWMKNELTFGKVKVTNNKANPDGHIVLNSMHKYIPRIHVANADDNKVVCTFTFMETQFIAVTAYQNTDVS